MSIGNWIVVAFVLFAGFIATLVTVCMRQDVNLVSKEYYKEELAYQSQVDRINNTAALQVKPVIDIKTGNVEIAFPSSIDEGELTLFRPSNPDLDKTFSLRKGERSQSFAVDHMKRGMYKAKLVWKVNGKEFYQEEVIYI